MGGMRVSDSNREIEIKLPLPSAAAGRRLLLNLGFAVVRPRLLEDNTLFDTPGATLRQNGTLLRLRRAGELSVLTYKGPAAITKYKSREELETEISNPDSLRLILDRLGFRPFLTYQKFRTEYAVSGSSGRIMLDETPIGEFLELEGQPRWIDQTARELGFEPSQYIKSGYVELYLAFGKAKGIRPTNMVFQTGRSPTPLSERG